MGKRGVRRATATGDGACAGRFPLSRPPLPGGGGGGRGVARARSDRAGARGAGAAGAPRRRKQERGAPATLRTREENALSVAWVAGPRGAARAGGGFLPRGAVPLPPPTPRGAAAPRAARPPYLAAAASGAGGAPAERRREGSLGSPEGRTRVARGDRTGPPSESERTGAARGLRHPAPGARAVPVAPAVTRARPGGRAAPRGGDPSDGEETRLGFGADWVRRGGGRGAVGGGGARQDGAFR